VAGPHFETAPGGASSVLSELRIGTVPDHNSVGGESGLIPALPR